ncbi:MAG: hypothetical protein K2Z80_07560 [Xanthobacteraceae bacterium]|nr:hypothetical protein [Xanthobacteraceae bacterium]
MATISMPKNTPSKENSDAVLPPASQARAALARFRLQVDRQTKTAFDTLSEAEKAGQKIKKAHPLVQVSIYDAEESRQTILG